MNPLSQFEIHPIILNYSINSHTDYSFTSTMFFSLLGVFVIFSYFKYTRAVGNGYYIPTGYQMIFEGIYDTIAVMARDSIGKQGEKYVTFLVFLFVFIFTYNILGLIPYSFTVTSHIAITMSLALIVFIGANIIGIKQHGFKMLGLFLPPGAPVIGSPFFVALELVTYSFRAISLAVRLFANMTSGHILFKVILTFIFFISFMVLLAGPMYLVFIAFLLLETGVGLIQAYVFTLLSVVYLTDTIHLH